MTYKIAKKNIWLYLIYIFILFPFFRISYFTENYPRMVTIYNIWLILSCILIAVLILIKKSYSKIINYLLLFSICLLISSFYNNDGVRYCLQNIPEILFLALFIDYGLKKNLLSFLKAGSLFLSFLTIINIISIFLYPKGMYINSTGFFENWILGYKNAHILFILPAIIFRFLYSYCKYNKLKPFDYLFLTICTISTFIVRNSTGIIGIMILWAYVIFGRYLKRMKIFNIANYALATIGLFITIVILRVQELFSYLIVNILKRDITFTGRIDIWDKAINYIKIKPWLGYGNVSFNYNNYIFSTHNTILGILHKVGFLGFASYVLIIYKSLKELWKNRDSQVCQFFSIIIFCYFIMMLVEAYGFSYYMFIFVIAYDISILKEREKSG